ncbi:unnamed protein product, partial [Penicillium nalgiovense]
TNVGAILMENISIIQIVSMFSIGAYKALETGIVTFDSFKRYRGLYFWSMQFASWRVLVHAIPAMARFISQASNLPTSIPSTRNVCPSSEPADLATYHFSQPGLQIG